MIFSSAFPLAVIEPTIGRERLPLNRCKVDECTHVEPAGIPGYRSSNDSWQAVLPLIYSANTSRTTTQATPPSTLTYASYLSFPTDTGHVAPTARWNSPASRACSPSGYLAGRVRYRCPSPSADVFTLISNSNRQVAPAGGRAGGRPDSPSIPIL